MNPSNMLLNVEITSHSTESGTMLVFGIRSQVKRTFKPVSTRNSCLIEKNAYWNDMKRN